MATVICSAAILAGGRATRFGGRDKSALVVDGRTILDRQIDALRALAGRSAETMDIMDIMIVGGGATHAPVTGVRTIADRVADSGPLGGLHAALSDARNDPLIL